MGPIETEIEKLSRNPRLYQRLGRDWPKYSTLLKNAHLRFIRATSDPSLPTRARGQSSEKSTVGFNY